MDIVFHCILVLFTRRERPWLSPLINRVKSYPGGMKEGRPEFSLKIIWGFPGGAVVENLPANAGDMGSSPGLGRSHMPRSN